MHELSLMQDLVDLVSEELEQERVIEVRLEVGRMTCVAPEALEFCFDICARGTNLEGATLDIIRTPGAELRLKEVEIQ